MVDNLNDIKSEEDLAGYIAYIKIAEAWEDITDIKERRKNIVDFLNSFREMSKYKDPLHLAVFPWFFKADCYRHLCLYHINCLEKELDVDLVDIFSMLKLGKMTSFMECHILQVLFFSIKFTYVIEKEFGSFEKINEVLKGEQFFFEEFSKLQRWIYHNFEFVNKKTSLDTLESEIFFDYDDGVFIWDHRTEQTKTKNKEVRNTFEAHNEQEFCLVSSNKNTSFGRLFEVYFDPDNKVDVSVAEALLTIQESYTQRYPKNGLYYITSKKDLDFAQKIYEEEVEGKIIESHSLQKFAAGMQAMLESAAIRRSKYGYLGMFQWIPVVVLLAVFGIGFGGLSGFLVAMALSTWSFLFVQYIPGWKINKLLLDGKLYASNPNNKQDTGEPSLKTLMFALVLWIAAIVGVGSLFNGGHNFSVSSTTKNREILSKKQNHSFANDFEPHTRPLDPQERASMHNYPNFAIPLDIVRGDTIYSLDFRDLQGKNYSLRVMELCTDFSKPFGGLYQFEYASKLIWKGCNYLHMKTLRYTQPGKKCTPKATRVDYIKEIKRLGHDLGGARFSNRYLVIVSGAISVPELIKKRKQIHAQGVATSILYSQNFSNLNPGFLILVSSSHSVKLDALRSVKSLKKKGFEAYFKMSGNYEVPGSWLTVKRGVKLILWLDSSLRAKTSVRAEQGMQVKLIDKAKTKAFLVKKSFQAKASTGGHVRLKRFRLILPKGGGLFLYKGSSEIQVKLSKRQQKRYLRPLGTMYYIETKKSQRGWLAKMWFH